MPSVRLLVVRVRAPTHTPDHEAALMTMTTTLPKSSAKWLLRRVASTSTTLPCHHGARAMTELSHQHRHPSTSAAAQHHHTVLVAMAKVNNSTDRPIPQAHGNEAQDTIIDARASTRSRWAKSSIRIIAPQSLSSSNIKINKTGSELSMRFVHILGIHTNIL